MQRKHSIRCGLGRPLIGAGVALTLVFTSVPHRTLAGTPIESGLVGLWEGENNALDTSGRGNHGTLVGGVTFAPGVVGQAFDFRGSLKYVRVPDHPSLDGFSQATWSFWVKLPNPTGSLMGFMDKRRNASTDNAYTIFVNNGSEIFRADFGIELGNASGGWSRNGAAMARQRITPNTWHHIATTFDMAASPNFAFYVDGVRCSLTALGNNLNRPIYNANAALVIGAVNSGTQGGVQGFMDQVALYNRALTPVEIAKLAGHDPLITAQPVSQRPEAGQSVTLSVDAVGTEPLAYQWRKDGMNLVDGGKVSGARTHALTLSNVLGGDAGGYSVAVSNAFGTVTSLVATLTVIDPSITGQPVSQTKNPGESVTFSVTAVGTQPLSYQWREDGTVVAGATATSLTLTNVQREDAGGYDVVVSNNFGRVTSAVAALTVNLATVDKEFNPGAGGWVGALALQPDGMIVAGGDFSTLAGQTRNRIGRLDAAGTLETGFNPGANGYVYSFAVQADGKILVGGEFTTLGGQPRNHIGRLNPDGSLDTAFNPGAGGGYGVESLLVQADGRIVVAGSFKTSAGSVRTNIARLNADGTLDAGFNPGATGPVASGPIFCLALQPDGKILVGGAFTSLGGQTRNYIGRLNADGSVDMSFNPGASYWVNCLAVQPDGRILVGGIFTTLGGQSRNKIARLNADGAVDLSFNPGASGSISYIWSLVAQTDGKILVCGSFTKLAGQTRNYIARLNTDGALEPTFNPPVAAGGIYAMCSLVVQPDGKILVGGDFTALGGQPRNQIGRLNNTDLATQSLSYDGGTLTWLRGGTSPEVWRTIFDVSTNSGADWIALGAGTRVGGGWQLTGVSITPNANIRARGFLAAGYDNASSWFVETNLVTSAPFMVAHPASTTNNVGTEARFTVLAGGTPPLSYKWRKNGTNLLGATSVTLTLTNVQESDQGLYSVVVSNAFGFALSSDAWLMVNQPPVADAGATQPMAISANGTNATVVLDGTRSSDPDGDPLQYLWLSTLNSQPSTLLASGAVAVVVLPVGEHSLLLVVDDGMLTATNAFTVEVLTSAQAVDRLAAAVRGDVSRAQPLIATLRAALASIDRSNPVSAINQLVAFQNQVRTQLEPLDAAVAASLIQAAQEVVDALSGGGTNPGGRPHGRFTAVGREPNGQVTMQFAAEPGPVYIVEASTNLVDWGMIGVAADQGDGAFTFEDANAARFPKRYYRLVTP